MTVPAVRACAVAIASLLVFAAAARAQDTEPEPINDSEGYTPPPETRHAAVDQRIRRRRLREGAGRRDQLRARRHARAARLRRRRLRARRERARRRRVDRPRPGRTVNGFLPRSAGIGGRPSFLLNTMDVDFKYTAPGAPLMVFSRVQFLPRFFGLGDGGDGTRVVVEQAFGRLVPFDSQELALSVGKFDSVFGIEYLDNQANIRTGVTPSLIARYTTGQSIGAKLFYRCRSRPSHRR
jgi:hypothetical protein